MHSVKVFPRRSEILYQSIFRPQNRVHGGSTSEKEKLFGCNFPSVTSNKQKRWIHFKVQLNFMWCDNIEERFREVENFQSILFRFQISFALDLAIRIEVISSSLLVFALVSRQLVTPSASEFEFQIRFLTRKLLYTREALAVNFMRVNWQSRKPLNSHSYLERF